MKLTTHIHLEGIGLLSLTLLPPSTRLHGGDQGNFNLVSLHICTNLFYGVKHALQNTDVTDIGLNSYLYFKT